MNNFTDEQFYAWLAGFIDGEGCIYIAKTKNEKVSWGFSYTLRLEITQANKPVLEKIKNRIGFGSNVWNKSILKNRKPNTWSEVYALKFSSNQAYEIIKNIYPYLVIKKKQASLAIEFQELVRGNYGRKKNRVVDYFERQVKYRDNLKLAKQLIYQAP